MLRQFSAGGAVYKTQDNKTYWLIIKPRPSKLFPTHRFQLPKGHIQEGESIENAAIREVHEETGINGRIVSKIGYSKYPLKIGEERVFKIVTYFLMTYASGQPTENDEVEKILWLPYEEAYKIITNTGEKSILEKASKMLKSL